MALYTGDTVTAEEIADRRASSVLGGADPSVIFERQSQAPMGKSDAMQEVDRASEQMGRDYEKFKKDNKASFELPSFFGDSVPGAMTAAGVGLAGLGIATGVLATKYAPKAAKTFKSLLSSKKGEDDVFNTPASRSSAQTIVTTASGPIDLTELPDDYRELVAKSARTTEQKVSNRATPPSLSTTGELSIPKFGESRPAAPMGAAPAPAGAVVPSATPAPSPVAPTAAPVAPPAAAAAPAATMQPAPAAPSAPAQATAPRATATPAVPSPEKSQQAMMNWVRSQMKQRNFTDLSDEAVQGFLRTFYGDAPINPGPGFAPEGYGAKFAEYAKQNIAGPGVGLPREEMKAIKARGAVAPPTEAAKGPAGQAGFSSMGGLASTALNAVGGLMLLDMFKKAQQTGDYSDFALGAIGQVLGNVAPKNANVGYMLMQPNTVSSGTLDSPEAQEMMRRRQAGAGRGFVNPPMAR